MCGIKISLVDFRSGSRSSRQVPETLPLRRNQMGRSAAASGSSDLGLDSLELMNPGESRALVSQYWSFARVPRPQTWCLSGTVPNDFSSRRRLAFHRRNPRWLPRNSVTIISNLPSSRSKFCRWQNIGRAGGHRPVLRAIVLDHIPSDAMRRAGKVSQVATAAVLHP